MASAESIEAENELRNMGAAQLREERGRVSSELRAVQEQIGDLAFHNYSTYADAGRTTQHCTNIFTEMTSKLSEVSAEVPQLVSEMNNFFGKARELNAETAVVSRASAADSPMWEIIGLPARMDVCIRAGYYEAAYSLTNYGMQLHQHAATNNPTIKHIADSLVESRAYLLEELFNKFAGPLDLAASIQVVNNVRKIPYLSAAQLRASVLQYRDVYLEKQLLDIQTHPDIAVKAISLYKDFMHDTMVLYMAVFPENEAVKKDPSVDPRWEAWPACAPSVLLGQWAGRHMHRLFQLIARVDMKCVLDMSQVWSKLMQMAASFGRMGMDFRSQALGCLSEMVCSRFRQSVRETTTQLVELKRLDVLNRDVGGLDELASGSADDAPPSPHPELSLWDDLCVYGNGLIEALGAMRYSLSPIMLSRVLDTVRDSVRAVLNWLAAMHAHANFNKAVRIFAVHFVPFLNRCVLFYFPHSVVARLFGTAVSRMQYERMCDVGVSQLAASCESADRLEAALAACLHRKTLQEIDLDAVLYKGKDKHESVLIPPAVEPVQQEEVVIPAVDVAEEEKMEVHSTAPSFAEKEQPREEEKHEPVKFDIEDAGEMEEQTSQPVETVMEQEEQVAAPIPLATPEKILTPVEVQHVESPEPVAEQCASALMEVEKAPEQSGAVNWDEEEEGEGAEGGEWGWGEEDASASADPTGQEEKQEWGWEEQAEEHAVAAPPTSHPPTVVPSKKKGKAD